jgi:hypothetical protein
MTGLTANQQQVRVGELTTNQNGSRARKSMLWFTRIAL